jgi:hypothetical protein
MAQQNAAIEEQVKKGAREEKSKAAQEIEDIKVVLSTRAGRRFIWRHLTNAGIFQTTFTGNSATFFNEGRRDIGLKILAEVNAASPESYLQMMKEANEGELND